MLASAAPVARPTHFGDIRLNDVEGARRRSVNVAATITAVTFKRVEQCAVNADFREEFDNTKRLCFRVCRLRPSQNDGARNALQIVKQSGFSPDCVINHR